MNDFSGETLDDLRVLLLDLFHQNEHMGIDNGSALKFADIAVMSTDDLKH